LAPGIDEQRANGHRQHEEMDVDLALLEVLPRINGGVPPARDQTHEETGLGQPGLARGELVGQQTRDAGGAADRRQRGQQAPRRVARTGSGPGPRSSSAAAPGWRSSRKSDYDGIRRKFICPVPASAPHWAPMIGLNDDGSAATAGGSTKPSRMRELAAGVFAE